MNRIAVYMSTNEWKMYKPNYISGLCKVSELK